MKILYGIMTIICFVLLLIGAFKAETIHDLALLLLIATSTIIYLILSINRDK